MTLTDSTNSIVAFIVLTETGQPFRVDVDAYGWYNGTDGTVHCNFDGKVRECGETPAFVLGEALEQSNN